MLDPQASAATGAGLALSVGPDFARIVAAAVADELERRGIGTTTSSPSPSPYLTVKEAAEYLRCRPQAIYDRIHEGALRPCRDGRRVLLRREDLDRYLAGGARS
jgi:excisionase family DNA binding protein